MTMTSSFNFGAGSLTQDDAVPLVQKKTLAKMGTTFVETVSSGPSAFALRQLKKFGWKEGSGLGKNLQGRAERVLVKKKVDATGVGCSKADAEAAAGEWWNSAFNNAAKSINVPSSSSSSSDDDSSDDDDSDDESNENNVSLSRDMSTYTDADIALFKACGGRRCGKRAGRLQAGKMKREQEADRKFLEKWGSVTASTTSREEAKEALKKAMRESALLKLKKETAEKEKRKKEKKVASKKRKAKMMEAAQQEEAKKSSKKAKKQKKRKKEKKQKKQKKKKSSKKE